MTKRILLVFLCLSLLVVSGCTEASLTDLAAGLKDAGSSLLAPEPAAPRLSPVDNTPENLALLDALGQHRMHDSRIFDFTAPEGTQKVIITQWELRDGQWVTPGGRALLLPGLQGRLGLSWDNLCSPIGIVLRAEGTTFAVSRTAPAQERPVGEQMVTMFQSMDVEIPRDTEIPLMMQIVTNAQEPPVIPLEYWQETERYAGHADVRLVTVRFSTEPMETEAPLLV